MSSDIRNKVDELNKQIEDFFKQGKYQNAIPLAEKALKLVSKNFDETEPLYANCLNDLGILYSSIGNYTAAEPFYIKAMELRRKIYGDKDPRYAISLHNLGTLYRNMGNYHKAEEYYNDAMRIRGEALGEEHPEYAMSLNNLGFLYLEMGNYAKAEPLYTQAMEIRRKTLGENHLLFAVSLSNLGMLYSKMGNYEAAEPMLKRTLDIKRKVLDETHPEIALSLNNLGSLYYKMGQFDKAIPYYQNASELKGKTLGEKHPSYATNISNLGALYTKIGKYKEADKLYQKAMEIREEALGTDHPDYALSLNNLGILYLETGDLGKSSEFLRKARKIWKKSLGEHHPDLARNLINIAKLCMAEEKYEEAYKLMMKAIAINDEGIRQVFSMGSESQRMAYLKTIPKDFDIFLSMITGYFAKSRKKIEAALNLVLKRKAIGAEALAAQRDAILGGKYPKLQEKLAELTKLRMQIAQKILNGPGNEGIETFKQMLDEWKAEKEKLESKLVKQIPEMNLEEKLRQVEKDIVAKNLPEKTALVEFVKFNVFDFNAVPANGDGQWKSSRYIAFILTGGESSKVKMIDLGESTEIDSLIDDFRISLIGLEGSIDTRSPLGPSFDESHEVKYVESNALRRRTFDMLLPALKGIDRILLVPDGDLNRLPFEVLPTDDGDQLIDKYQLSYLSVGRDILRFSVESSGKPTGSIVAADPDFDVCLEDFRKKQLDETEDGDDIHQTRDIRSLKLHFCRLPGTRPEGEHIAKQLDVEPWLDHNVLEASLKSLHSPFILHLATHGFFLENRNINQDNLDYSSDEYQNPLLRSGLALAGANTFVNGGELPEEAEDGILTAEDVSGIDLMSTQMVVLSACETGLGEIRSGEGVFGLRRAFVLSGARALIMSLWKVPDLATPILMERFYENLLTRGMRRDESLREAQLYTRDITMAEIKEKWLTDEMIDKLSDGSEIIKDQLIEFAQGPEDETPFRNPIYWGAFICQGDPGPVKLKH